MDAYRITEATCYQYEPEANGYKISVWTTMANGIGERFPRQSLVWRLAWRNGGTGQIDIVLPRVVAGSGLRFADGELSKMIATLMSYLRQHYPDDVRLQERATAPTTLTGTG